MDEIGTPFSAAMLSPREIRLVELFRSIHPIGRDLLIEHAESYAEIQNDLPDNVIRFPGEGQSWRATHGHDTD